jgi:hypothetical protein
MEGQLPGESLLSEAEEVGRSIEEAVRMAVDEVRQVRWMPNAGLNHDRRRKIEARTPIAARSDATKPT